MTGIVKMRLRSTKRRMLLIVSNGIGIWPFPQGDFYLIIRYAWTLYWSTRYPERLDCDKPKFRVENGDLIYFGWQCCVVIVLQRIKQQIQFDLINWENPLQTGDFIETKMRWDCVTTGEVLTFETDVGIGVWYRIYGLPNVMNNFMGVRSTDD